MDNTHERLGFSGAWVYCPAQPEIAKQYPDEVSWYAEWGTLAHSMLETGLKRGVRPSSLIPPGEGKEYTTEHGHTFSYEDQLEMKECASETYDYVQERLQELIDKGDSPKLYSERKLFIRSTGRDDLGGTADVIIISSTSMEVIDLKTGKGTYVLPSIPQLKLCALGAIEDPDIDTDNVEQVILTISQPRYFSSDKHRHILTTKSELSEYLVSFVSPQADWTDDGNAPAIPTPEGCKYCPARKPGRCKALEQEVSRTITGKAVPIYDVTPDDINKFKEVVLYDNNKLSAVLDMIPLVTNFCKDLEEHAIDIILHGERIDGYKVIETKGRQSWKDSEEVAQLLHGTKIAKNAFKKTVKTPKQVMSLDPSKQLAEKLKPLIVPGKTSKKLVLDTMPGKSVAPIDQFKPVTQSEIDAVTKQESAVEELPDFLL